MSKKKNLKKLQKLRKLRESTIEPDSNTKPGEGEVSSGYTNVFEFDTGLREYVINGYTIAFNPADPGFVTNFNRMLEHLSSGQDELRKTMQASKGESAIVIDAVDTYCAFGVSEFDECFGKGATRGMFEGCSPFAPQPGTNLPLWVVFCDFVADAIMTAIEVMPDEPNAEGLRVDGERSKALMNKYKVKYQTNG